MRFYYCILPHCRDNVKTLAGLWLGFFHFCGLALSHNKLVVYAFFLHKFSVSAKLCKSALVKDDKPVGVAEGGKSVSNGQRRCPHQPQGEDRHGYSYGGIYAHRVRRTLSA